MSGVQEYLEKHNIRETVELAINACVREKPEQPLPFLSQFLTANVRVLSGSPQHEVYVRAGGGWQCRRHSQSSGSNDH